MNFGPHAFFKTNPDSASPAPRHEMEFWYSLAAGVVLLVGVALSFQYREWSDESAQTEAVGNFERTADRLIAEIERRFLVPVYGMRGLAAMFAARDSVSAEEFRRHVAYRDLAREFPGVRGFGNAERVRRADMAAFVARMRASGAPEFDIRTSGEMPDLYVVKNIEPFDLNRLTPGFDMGSEAARRAAIEAAIERGEPVLTSPIALVRDEESGPGFLYVLPLYDNGSKPDTIAERRAQAIGVIFARLSVRDLLGSVASEFDGQAEFELFDGDVDSLAAPLFARVGGLSEAGSNGAALVTHRVIGDRILAIRVRPGQLFAAAIGGDGGDRIGFAAALAASVLLSLTILLLLIGRSRAVALARTMTDDLDRLAHVARKTTNAVAIAGRNRRIVWVNDGFEAMTGRSFSASVGRDISTLFPAADGEPQAGARLEAALAERRPFHGEFAGRRANGETYWSTNEIEPMLDRTDAFSGYMWLQTDITELKRKEIALETARRQAVSISEAKSSFLANMSHEIRTPMNGVLGLSRLLAASSLSAKQREYVSKIIASGETLIGIIGDILDFSKIEAGALKAEIAPFDLEHVLGKVTALFAPGAAEKGIEFLVDLADDVPNRMLGDALRLEQILFNLCGNALKFTSKGEIVVTIARGETKDGETGIEFSVRDSGIGMSPETLGRLFNPFMQADASTTRRYGGSGLGLAISRSLVELMGGTMVVRSTEGVGSVFSFLLPLAAAAGDETDAPDAPAARGRILVVDDNPIACRIAAKIVTRLGYDVAVASGGREALAALTAEGDAPAFDAVVLDCRMPGLDGFETAAEIRGRYPDIRRPGIVLVSALPHGETADRLAALGAQAPLNKPLDGAALSKAIRVSMGQDEPADDTPAPPTRRFEGIKVLIVDDNEINRQVAAAALEREGARTVLAADGRAALSALMGRDAFDMVLMDMHMPVMDGPAATRLIRADARFARLPIIGLTANAMREDLDICRAAGMADAVVKPFTLEVLYDTIARHLGVAPEAVVAKAAEPAPPATPAAAADSEIAFDRLASVVGGATAALSLLTQFRRHYADLADRLAAAVAEDPAGAGARLCHEIKGAAGNLGAAGLYAVLSRLESALKSGVSGVAAADMTAFGVRLRAVFDEIDARAAAAAPARSAEPVSARPGVGAAEIDALRKSLKESNLAAEDLWHAMEPRLSAGQLRSTRGVGAAIENLDFAAALSALDGIEGTGDGEDMERR